MKKFHNFIYVGAKDLYASSLCTYCNQYVGYLYIEMHALLKDKYLKMRHVNPYPYNLIDNMCNFLAEHSPCKNGISEEEYIIKNILE